MNMDFCIRKSGGNKKMRQERYDVSVNLKKREENKKTAYNIIEICKKNNWKKLE